MGKTVKEPGWNGEERVGREIMGKGNMADKVNEELVRWLKLQRGLLGQYGRAGNVLEISGRLI